MPDRIVYSNPGGSVSIIIPAPGIKIEDVLGQVPDGAAYHFCPVRDISSDRTFRDAWIKSGEKIDVHMGKARDIWRNKMREHRAAKLAALDVDYIRADEAGDLAKKKSISARKQALRDVTKHPDIEAAQTPEQLKSVWPSVLVDTEVIG